MYNPESVLQNEIQTSLQFWDTNGSAYFCKIVKKKKKKKKRERTWWILYFAVPTDHMAKIKESEKRDKELNLARKLKKLWNIKVTVILIVIGALGTVIKELVHGRENLEIRGQVETIQTTALLRSARILRRVLNTRGNLLLPRLQRETTS